MGPLLGKLDDLEREVNRVRAQPSRIDETRIEDRMIALQRRIDEGITAGRLTRVQEGNFKRDWMPSEGNFAADKGPALHPRGKSRYFQPP